MKQSHFFAHLSRLKLINRWPLMRNVRTENVSEHSLQVAMVAHALAAIKNRKFGGNVNAERIALLAMYHDASEVLTGDLPTPVKYFNSQIAQEYKAIEKIAQQKLVDMVPEELRDIFAPLIDEHAYSDEEKSLVKQADGRFQTQVRKIQIKARQIRRHTQTFIDVHQIRQATDVEVFVGFETLFNAAAGDKQTALHIARTPACRGVHKNLLNAWQRGEGDFTQHAFVGGDITPAHNR